LDARSVNSSKEGSLNKLSDCATIQAFVQCEAIAAVAWSAMGSTVSVSENNLNLIIHCAMAARISKTTMYRYFG